MERFINSIKNNEDWLIVTVMAYVNNLSHEYTYLFDEKDFHLAIADLSFLFVKVLQDDGLALNYSYVNNAKDSIATLGKLKAQNYLQRGMNSQMILCLFNSIRQSYIDLVLQSGWEPDYEKRCQIQVLNFFYCIDFGIILLPKSQQELVANNKDLEQQVLERYTSREELLMANHQLKNIIDFLPNATFIIDKHKRVIAWNKAMQEMTGVIKEDILGKGDYAYTVPFHGKPEPILIDLITSDNQQALEKYNKIEKQGVVLIAESYVPAFNNGQGAYLRSKASLLYDDLGNYIGAIETIHDITDLKKSEAALHKEKEQLAVTLASIGDAVIVVDLKGYVTLLNQVAETLIGYTRTEAIGQPLGKIFNILNEYTREPVENPVKKVLTEGKIVGLANHTALIAKDGTERSISDSASPIIDAAGNILGAILVFRDVTDVRQREEALRKSEKQFRFLAENAQDIIYRIKIQPEPNFEYISPAVTRITGYDPKELYQNPEVIYQIVHPDDQNVLDDLYVGKYGFGMPIIVRWFHKDGHLIWTEQHNTPIYNESSQLIAIEGIVRDVTERKLAEEKARTADKRFRDIVEFLPDPTFVIDKDKKVIAWNKAMEEMTNTTKDEIIGKSNYNNVFSFNEDWPMLIDYIITENVTFKHDQLLKHYNSVKRQNNVIYGELFIPDKDKTLMVGAAPLYDSEGKIVGAIESIRDITDRQKAEEKLKYITFHDALTNVYSRAYFEQEMHRLASGRFNPVGIVIGDVDGLKLVNDTLGHNAGDQLLSTVATLMQKSFRSSDVVARIGGDEFAVLLPNCNEASVKIAYQRIKNGISVYNSVHETMPLSLSIGYAVGNAIPVNMNELFKEADNNMYRKKLHRHQSARSAIVNTLNKALEARDLITEGHADRLKDQVESLAKAIGLSERPISDLRLLAQFHDIGKVGIPDSILFKNSSLIKEEFFEMQRHCEIGFRIAQSAPDLVPIADWILKHHERWDGKGYPLGLQGNEIPLECRILAIADAYDAMVSDRPYRKAMSRADALKEINRCAGSQFDPILADKFINIIILSTTTSTQDSGLLDVLVPKFQEQTGYTVKIVAVGTGEALKMGKTGDADVLLVHAPKDEELLVNDQVAINYQLVMHNDFVLLGPPQDPAKVNGTTDIMKAFKKIANNEALFISRGDDSGTDKAEKSIWAKIGIDYKRQNWYQEIGQGMGATITVANEKQAYMLSDRGTFLAKYKNIELQIVSEGDEILKNIYHVMQVNPEKFEWINVEGAKAFVEFMINKDTQQIIKEFGVDKFGSTLFFPDRLNS